MLLRLQIFISDSRDKIAKLERMVEAAKYETANCLKYLAVTGTDPDAFTEVMGALSAFNAQISRAAEEISPKAAPAASLAKDAGSQVGPVQISLFQRVAQSPMVRNGQLNATIRTLRMPGGESMRAGQHTARRNRMLWDGGSMRGGGGP